MTRSIKWSLILMIFLMFLGTVVFATDINMNLGNNPNSATNEASNSEQDNTLTEESTTNTATQNEQTNNSTTITSVSAEEETSLSFNNILNILLIVIGIVLILLGIAILIRLK